MESKAHLLFDMVLQLYNAHNECRSTDVDRSEKKSRSCDLRTVPALDSWRPPNTTVRPAFNVQ